MARNYSVQTLIDGTGRVPAYKVLSTWGMLDTAKAVKSNHPDAGSIRIVDMSKHIVVG